MRGFGGFHGGFWGVHGGLEGSRGVYGSLLYLYKAHFARLEVLYGTRLDSKHPILFQMANLSWIGITDPFLNLWALLGPPTGHFRSKMNPIGAPNSLISGLSASE